MTKKYNLRKPVIFIPATIFILLLIIGTINPTGFINTLNENFENMMVNLGWFVSLTILFFIIICIAVIFHPIGNIRLGGPNAKPKMSYWQWFAIALCTGVGAGIVFWGAAEPLLFAMEPAPSLGLEPGSNEAILWSMRTSFLHWTITPYTINIIFGLVLAYAVYNMRMPYRASSCLVPALGKKFLDTKWATIFDVFVVFAIVGAVAGGLGYGVLQLTQGARLILGIEPSTQIYFLVAFLLFAVYMTTSLSGLKKGINWISDKNVQIFFILMFFMLIAGPTSYILNLGTQSLGSFIGNFVESMTYTAPFPDGGLWPQWWDMYWWVDWLAYAPVLGMFYVRLGYGRTLREFVVVNMIMPALFGFAWFAVYGGTVIHAQLFQGIDFYSIYLQHGAEALTLSVFEIMPFSQITTVLMSIVVIISLATQCDSMVVTLSSMSITTGSESEEGPKKLKWFWGILMVAIALLFTLTGGIEGIKIIKGFSGMPITFIGLFMIIGFMRYMSKRPRINGRQYVYEDVIANAPDSGEKPMEQSALYLKFKALFNKEKSEV